MDTQNDGLEKVIPSTNGIFFVSMLDFWGAAFEVFAFFTLLHDTLTNVTKISQ